MSTRNMGFEMDLEFAHEQWRVAEGVMRLL